MTAAATLHARQRAPGDPVSLSATWSWDSTGYNAESDFGLGVMTSAGPPVNVSDFAHTWVSSDPDFGTVGLLGNLRFSEVVNHKAGAFTAAVVSANQQAVMPIDANIVVGRYLFAYSRAGTAVQAHSAGYHIT